MALRTKYEVQFRDGLGAWRRWSLNSTWDRAHASRLRLVEQLGKPSWAIPARIVEVRKEA